MSSVYILSNEFMPDLVKIGYTSRNPSQRISELFTTSVPGEFKAEKIYQFESVEIGQKAEKFLHVHYKKYRIAKNREYFSAEILASVDRVVKHKFPKHIEKIEQKEQERLKIEGEKRQRDLEYTIHKQLIKEVNKNIYNIENLNRGDRNDLARKYLKLSKMGYLQSYEDIGQKFTSVDLKSIDKKHMKPIAAYLLKKSEEHGHKGIYLYEGLSISRSSEWMDHYLNDLEIDLSKECYLRSPSKIFAEHIYDKKNDKERRTSGHISIHDSIFEFLADSTSFFSYHKKYVNMNRICGNLSRREASSYLKEISPIQEMWTDLKEVSNGTRDRQKFEKTILGKTSKLFKLFR